MKYVKNLILIIIAIIMVFAVIPMKDVDAAGRYEDKILYYGIEADPQDDGSVVMTYSVKWQVLRNSSNGKGVSWVNIGVANKNVKKLTALSSNIKNIEYFINP